MQLLGVVGWPIDHSRSPAMQNAALSSLKLPYYYLALALPPAELARFVSLAAELGFAGLNVTAPHKEAALRLCEPDALAVEVGAVNTLSFAGGKVAGTNTDVYGLEQLLDEAAAPASGDALILGAGGAARAALIALVRRGLAPTVVSRRGQPLAGAPGASWDELPELLPRARLVVDATPRGLGAGPESLPLDRLADGAMVVDLVARKTTPLVDAARRRGLNAHSGVAMLLHQGAAALEHWIGRAAPVEVMRQALLDSL
jgi:shikimate dehydrogenase